MKGKESRGHNSRARHSLVKLIRHSKANDGHVSLKLRTERPLKLRSCGLVASSEEGTWMASLFTDNPVLLNGMLCWESLKIWQSAGVYNHPSKTEKTRTSWNQESNDKFSLSAWLLTQFPVTSLQPPVCQAEQGPLHLFTPSDSVRQGLEDRGAIRQSTCVHQLSVSVTNYLRQST